MYSHYGVGTSTEPIVISDDEDEAAFVEFTLEQRISSPTDSIDYIVDGWRKEQSVYVEGNYTQEKAAVGFPAQPDIEPGLKRKRASSINGADDQPFSHKPGPQDVSLNGPQGETRQARRKRRKREKQAAEAARVNAASALPSAHVSQSHHSKPATNLQQVKPKFPLPPKPTPVFLPSQSFSVSHPLTPASYAHAPITPTLPQTPAYSYDRTWAQIPARPPVEPPPGISVPPTIPQSVAPTFENPQIPKKTIGMPPDSDPHSRHGVYILPPHHHWKPNPARSLVIELLPKKFRTLGFILDWAGTVCPPGTPPRVELDARVGKALIEFPSADIARSAWESPRLHGGGREHVRAYWYRLPGMGADAGVGELEEGEVEDGELVNAASMKADEQMKRRNRAPSITTSVASTSALSNNFSVPYSPSSFPSSSSATSVTFADGKWRSKSIVQAEDPPSTPSLPPGARWAYQDGRWVIQYSRSSLEPDHLPAPISLSAFVDPHPPPPEDYHTPFGEDDALDPDSDEALLKLMRGEAVVFTDGRRFPPQPRNRNSMGSEYLSSPISLSALAQHQGSGPAPPPNILEESKDFDSQSRISSLHRSESARGSKSVTPSSRHRSVVSESPMELASENGDVYTPITSVGSSFAIGPPEAHPELSPRAYIAALTGSTAKLPSRPINDQQRKEPIDSDSDMQDLLYPVEPPSRLTVHAPSPQLPAKPASLVNVMATGVTPRNRSSTPSPSPSATAAYSNIPLPVDKSLKADDTQPAGPSASTSSVGAAPSQTKAQDLKRALLARQKELEEAIKKTKGAVAAKMAIPRSKTGTPTTPAREEPFEDIPGLTAAPPSSLTPETKAMQLEPDPGVKARNSAKEDELRQLVLNSKKSRVGLKASAVSHASSPTGSSTAQDGKPVAIVTQTTTTTTTTTTQAIPTATANLDDLAASFIAETIQTVSGPSTADKSASPEPPPPTASRPGPVIVLPPGSASGSNSEASSSLKASLTPLVSGFQGMSEFERLVYKEKLLGRKIAESKMYMEQYMSAPTKALKKQIMKKLEDRMRLYDEKMEALANPKPQTKHGENQNVKSQLHLEIASSSRGSTPGFTNTHMRSHPYGSGGRQSPWWPDARVEEMIIDISDDEESEESEEDE